MNKKKCLGCGSVLQSENAGKEGFVKLSVYDKFSAESGARA